MSFREVRDKNSGTKDLKNRLIPRQQIINKPVTLNSCFGSIRPKTRSAKRHEIKSKLPPIISPRIHTRAETPKRLEQAEPEPNIIPDNFKTPFEFVDYVKKNHASTLYVYLWPNGIIEDSEHPTNLEIIPPNKVSKREFITLSLKGLTHVRGDDVDFIPLDEWLKGNEMFSRIIEIPFFKYQRQWRHFRTWKNLVQASKIHAASSSLTHNLFFADIILREAYIQVQRKLDDLHSMKLFSLQPTGKYRIDHFIEDNKKHCAKMNQIITDMSNCITDYVNEACEKTRESLDSPERQYGKEEKAPLEAMIQHYKKTKTAGTNILDNMISYEFTKKASYRAACTKLVRFIRMIDYNVINALRSLCFNSILSFLAIFETLHEKGVKNFNFMGAEIEDDLKLPVDMDKAYQLIKQRTASLFTTPVFWIDMHFDGTISWTPSPNEIKERIEQVRNEFIEILFKIPRLLTNPLFANFIASNGGSDTLYDLTVPDLGGIIFNDVIYKETAKHTTNLLTAEFALLDHYNTTFDQPVNIYKSDKKYDLSFMYNPDITAEEITVKISELKSEEILLKSVVESKNVGIFFCVSLEMKKNLITSPGICIDRIKQLIPVVFKRNLKIFEKHMNHAFHNLSVLTSDIQSFVRFIDATNKYNDKLKGFVYEQQVLNDLSNLAIIQGVIIPEKYLELYTSLVPILENVKQILSTSLSKINEEKDKFTLQLDENISKLNKNIQEIKKLANEPRLEDPTTTCKEAAKILVVLTARADDARALGKKYNSYKVKMGFQKSKFEDAKIVQNDINSKKLLWETKTLWEDKKSKWFVMAFREVDPDEFTDEIKKFKDSAFKARKALPKNKVAEQLDIAINDVAKLLPAIKDLNNPALNESHRSHIEVILGTNIFSAEKFTIQQLIERGAYDFVETINEISVQATNEKRLLNIINQVSKTIDQLQFGIRSSKWMKSSYELTDFDDVIMTLEDAKNSINSILSSQYVASLREAAQTCEKNIKQMFYIVRSLKYIQEQWNFISSIYPAGIRPSSTESKEITIIEKIWRSLTTKINEDQSVLRICMINQTTTDVDLAKDSVKKLLKLMNNDLDNKRINYPRLFFMSNKQLLNIISRSKDPTCIYSILPQIFDGINNVSLVFDNRIPCITSIGNSSGEILELRPVKFRSNIDTWLSNIDEISRRTLKNEFKVVRKNASEMVQQEWVKTSISQVAKILTHIEWTDRMNLAFNSFNTEDALSVILEEVIKIISNYSHELQTPNEQVEIMRLRAQIELSIYHRDKTQQFINEGVAKETDFEWFKQAKFAYNEEAKDVTITIGNYSFVYNNEFSDCVARTVISSTSDNAFFTISSAVKHFFGGALFGEAESGKTETLKEIARTLGIFCYIVNCTSTSTINQISRAFKGGVMSNAWVCYKNFDLVPVSVSSVLTDYIRLTHNFSVSNQRKCDLFGTEISAPKQMGIFLTYKAGDKRIPDSLQAYFRPIEFNNPPIRSICEAYLWSLGFTESIVLSQKISALLSDLKSLFSTNKSYTFGIRTLKLILVNAERFLKRNKDLSEYTIIVCAIKFTLSQMIKRADRGLLDPTIENYFPDINVNPFELIGNDTTNMNEAAENIGLTPSSQLIHKACQIRDLLIHKKGIILYGHSSSGKTSAIRTLQSYYNIIRKTSPDTPEIVYKPILSGMLSRKEMFGEINNQAGVWDDGIASNLISKSSTSSENKTYWISIDGSIYYDWEMHFITTLSEEPFFEIENGEHILIKPNMEFFFETTDISRGTPSLFSQCGFVYFDYNSQYYDDIIKAQRKYVFQKRFGDQEKLLQICDDLINRSFYRGVAFYEENGCPIKEIVSISLITSFFKVFKLMIDDLVLDETDKESIDKMTKTFIIAYIWVFGGCYDYQRRQRFESMVRDSFHGTCELPKGGSLFDWCYDAESNSFQKWDAICPKFNATTNNIFEINPQSVKSSTLFVPTAETERSKYILSIFIRCDLNILVRGPNGSGKTKICRYVLDNIEKEGKLTTTSFEITKATTVKEIMSVVENSLETKKFHTLVPTEDKKKIFLLEGIDSITENESGERAILEFLRSISDFGGSYFLRTKEWHNVERCNFFGIGRDDGYNKPFIDGRCSRHFINYELSIPDSSSIFKVMYSVFTTFFTEYNQSVRADITKIVNGTIFIYDQMNTIFAPKASTPHYVFNMHDIEKVMLGVLRSNMDLVTDGNILQLLWAHEMQRVFCDKLFQDDKQKFYEQLLLCIKKTGLTQNIKNSTTCVFGNFNVTLKDGKLDEMCSTNDGYQEYHTLYPYKYFKTIDPLTEVFQNHINTYQITKRITDEKVVMFNSQAEHIARIHRVLSKPTSHMVLLGNKGTGRHVAAKVACSLTGIDYVEYNSGFSFKDDLKSTLQKTLSGSKGFAIVVNEEMLINPEIASVIVNILNLSALHTLFTPAEYEDIINDCVPTAKANGQNESKANLGKIFTDRVNENIHLIFFMNPTSKNFLKIISDYPSIVSMCSFDTFSEFQISFLQSFGEKIIMNSFDNKALSKKIAKIAMNVYENIEEYIEYAGNHNKVNVMPSVYVRTCEEFIKRYKINIKKRNERIKMLTVIINLVKETERKINENEKKIEETTILLNEKKHSISEIDFAISTELIKSDSFDKSMKDVAEQLEKKQMEVNKLREEQNIKITDYKKGIEECIRVIKDLPKEDILAVENQEDPSPTTKTVMKIVCILMDAEPTWEKAKSIISDSLFLYKITSIYSAENGVSQNHLQQISSFIDNNFDFSLENAEKEGFKLIIALCDFILKLADYEQILTSILPNQEELESMSAELTNSTKKLSNTDTSKSIVSEKIIQLQKERENINIEACSLSADNKESYAKIESAKELIGAIGKEVEKWNKELEEEKDSLKFVIGDSLLQSLILIFGAPLSREQREKFTKKLKEICKKEKINISETFNFVKSLISHAEVDEWCKKGLKNDATTIENFAILMNAPSTPFIIDPLENILEVIKSLEEKRNPMIMRFESNFTRGIEAAIRAGIPTIIPDVKKSIPSIYNNLLSMNIIQNDDKPIIRIGDRVVEVDNNFRMYIFSKSNYNSLSSRIQTKATVIDFSPSEENIKNESLSQIISYARKELEIQLNTCKKKKEIEENTQNISRERMFELLISADSKTILEDKALIDELKKINSNINQTFENIKVIDETISNIQKDRNEFIAAANRLSVLTKQTKNLASLHPLYNFGFRNFKFDLKRCLRDMTDEMKPVDVITYSYYESLMRSVFANHRPIVSFLFCTAILVSDGRLKQKEVDILLNGPNKTFKSKFENPLPDLISDESWCAMQALAIDVPAMRSLPNKIMSDNETFANFLLGKTEGVPDKLKKGLSDFQLILLYNIFLPSAVPHAMSSFVSKNLSPKFSRIKEFTISDVIDLVSSKTPIMIYVNMNESQIFQLQAIAVISKATLKVLSLPHNKATFVEQFINSAIQKGDWVYLENINSAEFEVQVVINGIISKLKSLTERHPTFKLFISANSQQNVPNILVSRSIKFASQRSMGVVQTLTLLIHTIPLTLYRKKRWTRFTFLVAVFHSVLSNRLQSTNVSYIPLTFNTYNDAIKTIEMIIERDAEVEVPVIDARKMTIDTIYGSHIIDPIEKESFNNFITTFFSEEHIDGLTPLTEDGSLCLPDDDSRESFMKYLENIPQSINYLWKSESSFDDNEEDFIAECLEKLSAPKVKHNPLKLISETLEDLKGNLPTIDEISSGNEILSCGDLLTPCLTNEAEFLHNFLEFVSESIEDLSNTVKGLRIVTEESEKDALMLANGDVPTSWIIKGTPKSLSLWMSDIQKRANFINGWIRKGRPLSLLLSAFREPSSLFTYIKQVFSQETGEPMEKIHLVGSLTIKEPENTEKGVIWLKNIFLKNSAWNELAQILSVKGETDNLWLKLSFTTSPPTEMCLCPLYVHKEVVSIIPLPGGAEWKLRKVSIVAL